MERVFLGLPMGSRQYDIGASIGWCHPTNSGEFEVEHHYCQGGYTFANLWADALNRRSAGVTHFAMIHTDADPELYWLDVYKRILRERNAKFLSAVMAMNDGTENTSTGYFLRDSDSRGTNLTLQETGNLPETFSIRDVKPGLTRWALAINTGLWLADIRGKWAEDMEWVGKGGIEKKRDNGKVRFVSWFRSEDWYESRRLAKLLQPDEILATTAVYVDHWHWVPKGNKKRCVAKPADSSHAGAKTSPQPTGPCVMAAGSTSPE